MSKFNSRALSILHSEGIAGLLNRIASRLLQKPQIINLYVLKLDYKDIAKVPRRFIDLEIGEVTEMDDSDLEALAAFHFYGHSKGEILQHLAEGQRCYIAKHQGQVISCYWRATRNYYDYYLKRRFYLADNEEYLLGAFTLVEFRNWGVLPHLVETSSRERAQNCPNLRAFSFVRTNNKASLRTSHKLGFNVIGRVGFVEMFGIRYHFLLGHEALPKTTRRNFFSFFSAESI